MPNFATTEDTPLVRLDYSNDRLWRDVLAEARTVSPDSFGGYDFVAHVEVFEDPNLSGANAAQLARRASVENENIALCVFADAVTMGHPEHPLLCIDLINFAELRVVPSQLQSIENNLSVGTAEMGHFVKAADDDGIFRGFKE